MSDLSDLYAEAAVLKAASVDTANHYNQAYAFLGAIQRFYDYFFEYTVNGETGAITVSDGNDAWDDLDGDFQDDLLAVVTELDAQIAGQ